MNEITIFLLIVLAGGVTFLTYVLYIDYWKPKHKNTNTFPQNK